MPFKRAIVYSAEHLPQLLFMQKKINELIQKELRLESSKFDKSSRTDVLLCAANRDLTDSLIRFAWPYSHYELYLVRDVWKAGCRLDGPL